MNQDPETVGQKPDPAQDVADTPDRPAGLDMKDPTDTDHPTGQQQAAENAATESPA